MRSGTRYLRAHLYYLRQPTVQFLPLLIGFIVLLLLGGLAFQRYYTEENLTFIQALYVTYSLVWGEPLNPFPGHWALESLCIILPPVGLVVILDGIVRFSYHILRRDETGKEWVLAMAKTLDSHVILCGLGNVGLRILQQLVRLGEQVIVLEKDPQCPNLAYARKNNVPVRIGNGREEGIFDELNVAHAKSIILATNDDLANLEMALDARKAKPGIRVVMRMFDQELAGKIRDSFDLQLVFSTAELAAPLFATASSDHSIVNSFYVDGQLLVVANLTIHPDSELVGRRVRDFGKDRHIFVISHQHGGVSTLYPAGDVEFAAGDRITLQTTPEILREIHALNRDPQPW